MRRGVEAGDLIAPGTIEGVFRRRHQLDMSEAHLHAISGELLAEFAVIQDAATLFGYAAPGGQMHLIDGHRPGT